MPAEPSCPIPLSEYPRVLMAHGGGGRLMHGLLERLFLAELGGPELAARTDAAVLCLGSGRIALTTDSYVVQPLFFPGGDIGKLAVCGTVNDLATSGARPRWISAAFILEEGLSMETLWRVVRSLKQTAVAAGVSVVTGDTKVIERGSRATEPGLFINTTGLGVIEHDRTLAPSAIRPGDRILVTGDLGRHGIAVMNARENLGLEHAIESDVAPLAGLVEVLLKAGIEIHCLRDLTRGGLASALVELSTTSGLGMEIREEALPVLAEVRAACEILGLDPLSVANEGCLVAFIPDCQAECALALLRTHPGGSSAASIGQVLSHSTSRVRLRTSLGVNRIVEMFSGEQLPRIC